MQFNSMNLDDIARRCKLYQQAIENDGGKFGYNRLFKLIHSYTDNTEKTKMILMVYWGLKKWQVNKIVYNIAWFKKRYDNKQYTPYQKVIS